MTGFVYPRRPALIKFHPQGWGWYTIRGLLESLQEIGSVSNPYQLIKDHQSLSKDKGYLTVAARDGRRETVSMEALLRAVQELQHLPNFAEQILVPAGWGNQVLDTVYKEMMLSKFATATAEAISSSLQFYQQGYTVLPADRGMFTELLLSTWRRMGVHIHRIENKLVVTGLLCVHPDRFDVDWLFTGSTYLSNRNRLLEEGWQVVAADEMMSDACVYFLRPKQS